MSTTPEKCPTCGRPFASHRSDDPATSAAGAAPTVEREGKVLHIVPHSHKARLLVTYPSAPGTPGRTDRSAADIAGLLEPGVCWWKRASELRQGGYIEPTGHTAKDPVTGRPVRLCRLTEKGLSRKEELLRQHHADSLAAAKAHHPFQPGF